MAGSHIEVRHGQTKTIGRAYWAGQIKWVLGTICIEKSIYNVTGMRTMYGRMKYDRFCLCVFAAA